MDSRLLTLSTLFLFAALTLGAAGAGAAEVQSVLLGLSVILVTAAIGGNLSARFGQPAVLGELIGGIVVGNLALVGLPWFDFLKHSQTLHVLSELGVVLLMFEVGLETSLVEMMKVGVSSLLAAVLGVVAPFALGWMASSYFFPEKGLIVHAFIGAVLCATSVGITARVLKESNKIKTAVGRIILGAAVIDDILGLLVLAVMVGIIGATNANTELNIEQVLQIAGIAIGFLAIAIGVGRVMVARLFSFLSRTDRKNALFPASLIICFLLSYLAAVAGLAPIVGAFAAGLVIDQGADESAADKYFERSLSSCVEPITTLLVPVFFVLMGAQVDLKVFADTQILSFALVLTVVAVIGKQACSFGVLEKGVDKIAVGLGMIPRGEVGLIFASIGATLMVHGERVIDAPTFGAVVVMVVLTTIATPPILKWRLERPPSR